MNPFLLSILISILPGFNQTMTPGAYCEKNGTDYIGMAYDNTVPICKRHVTNSKKVAVAKLYGIDKKDIRFYRFDHYIPISLGGSNDIKNIWPEPIRESKKKDEIEKSAIRKLKSKQVTYKQAIQMISDYVNQ